MRNLMTATCGDCGQEVHPAATSCHGCRAVLRPVATSGLASTAVTAGTAPSTAATAAAPSVVGAGGARGDLPAVRWPADPLTLSVAGLAAGSAGAARSTTPLPVVTGPDGHGLAEGGEPAGWDGRGEQHWGDLHDPADLAGTDLDVPQEPGYWDAHVPQRRRRWLPLVAAAVLVVVGLALAFALLHRPASSGAAAVTGSTAAGGAGNPSAAGASHGAAGGPGATVDLDGDARAQAPATSPDGTDAAGHRTSYAAANLLDGDPATAWRMDGDGAGQVLTFTLASPHVLRSLAVVNGYAKVDPVSGADRYTQERRVTHVTWFVDGRAYPQVLQDGVRTPQVLRIAPVSASQVRLRLDATTAPGDPAFDRTALSGVILGG